MGDVSYVLKKYMNHVQRDIHQRPHMRFDTGGVAVRKLTSLYIIGDTAGKSDCYICSHGGNYSADYVLDCSGFSVPTGVSINFYQPAGYAFGMWTRLLRNQQPVDNNAQNDLHYGAGDDCPNYILTKLAGRHQGIADYAANEENYQGWQTIAADADIVMVSPRNRWFHSGLTLKSTIKNVQSAYPAITTFNCLFCRVDDSSAGRGNHTWNAGTGDWY